jgi:hypothetical protein
MDDDDQKSRLQQNKTGHGFFKSAFGKADSSDAASDAQAPKDTVAEGDLVVEQFWRNHYEHAFHTATEKIQALEVHIDHLEKVIAELRQSHLITAPRPPRQATPGFAPDDGAAHQKELQRIAQQSNREVAVPAHTTFRFPTGGQGVTLSSRTSGTDGGWRVRR